MAIDSQIVKIEKKSAAFPRVCPHCMELASNNVPISSEEKLIANYIFFTKWKQSYVLVPFCTEFAKRKQKVSKICMVVAFGFLVAYIFITLLLMRPVEGNEAAIVFLIFIGIFWIPLLLVRPGKYIKLLNSGDNCIEFQIRNPRYAKMLAILNGVSIPESNDNQTDKDDSQAFSA